MLKSRSTLLALLLLTVLGCGGSDSHSPVQTDPIAVPISAFVGSWSGTYAVVGNGTAGTMKIDIVSPDASHPMSAAAGGLVVSSEFGNGKVSGTIDVAANSIDPSTAPSFTFTFTFTYDVPPAFGGASQDNLHECDAKIDARGHLILNQVHVTSGIYFAKETFDLAPVATS